MPHRRFPRTLLILLDLAWCSSGRAAAPFNSATVDELVESALKTWKVPGAALAIVHGDAPVYLSGYGVRDTAEKQPVTPDTLFPIASCTKAFTATAIAMLADDGKMDWDDPVRKYVEFFHLADPLADANVTIRDLLAHRTGLSRHDWLWYKSPFGREEIIRRIGHVQANRPFRSAYQYQNIMYLTAGYAAGRAAGCTWEDLLRSRIFEPLGMKSANFSTKDLERCSNCARPHVKHQDGSIRLEPYYNIDHMGPAGSINASVRDLVPWLQFQLGDGTFNSKRLISKLNFDEMRLPQTVIRLVGREKELNPESLHKSYGLGWLVQDYRGRQLLSHTGGLDGFRCRIVVAPQAKLALALLTNSDVGNSGASLHTAVTNSLVDLILDSPRTDWNALYTKLADQADADAKSDKQKKLEKRQPGTKPSHDLAAYAGKYEHAAYGTVDIACNKDVLTLRWSGFRKLLDHFHFDTFIVKTDNDDDLDAQQVLFRLGSNGTVESLRFLEVDFKRKQALK